MFSFLVGALLYISPKLNPVSMVVTPGNTTQIGGNRTFTITRINPNWELMSGNDKGKMAYTVTLSVEGDGETFMRQLIAGYPEYTEDIVRSGDPKQPMARAKNVVGRALFDEDLDMQLMYDSKDEFLLTQSGALYLRELTADRHALNQNGLSDQFIISRDLMITFRD